MNKQHTYYKKVGRKYIPIEHYEMEGVPEGLYLFYKKQYSHGMMNMLSYAKLHDIKNINKWSDLEINFGDELREKLNQEIESWIQKEKRYSLQDLTNIVFKVISEFENKTNQ